MGILIKKSLYNFFIFLCFIALSNNVLARQKDRDKKFPAEEFFQKAKQFGDANQFDSSIFFYQKALTLYELEKDWRGIVLSHTRLGACHIWLSRYEKANDFLKKGLKTGLERLGEADSTVAETYATIGFYHGRSGDFEKQLNAHQKALKIGIKALGSEHPKVSEYYSNCGSSYGNKGNYDKAIINIQKGLDIRIKLNSNPTGLFQSYNNLGAIYQKTGEYDKSLRLFQQALSLVQADSTKSLEKAIGYNNFGKAFEAKGNIKLAYNYFEKALGFFTTILGEDHYYAGILSNNLGSLLLQQREYDKALEYFSTAQNIFKKLDPNHPYVALIHVNMGKCYDKKGQSRKDLEHLEKAISLQKRVLGHDHPDIASTLNNLGVHHFQKNNPTVALHYFQEALISLIPDFENENFYINPSPEEKINSKMILLQILQNKAKALEGLFLQEEDQIFNLEHALDTYQVAIQLIDVIRFGFTSEESQKELTDNSFSVYEGAIQMAHKLYGLLQDEKYLYKAFNFSQKSKAFLLLQAIKKTQGLTFAGIPDSLIDQEINLKTNVAFYERELHVAKQKRDSIHISLYQNYLFQYNSELDLLNHRLEEDYPKYYQLKYHLKLPALSEIQKSLLNETTVLLDYFEGDSSINIFTLSKDKLRMFVYGKPENFEELVMDFKKSTEDWQFINNNPVQANELYIHSGFQLYQILLRKPLESINNSIQKLIVIPGGVLGYVNFEAFLSKLPTNPKEFRYNDLPYLIKDYDVQYLYSAATLLNGKENLMASTHRNIGAFGGFAVEDISLPGTVPEVNRIAESIGGDAWTGIHATESNFKANVHNYPLLHLSMHTYLDDINPLYSKFVFTQSQDAVEDDSLTIAEIYNMRINAQLAVLSACETGQGALSRGEGIMSLSRAFAYAGCPSVVTSLWKVDSETASTLMLDFYKNLTEGIPKDRSLRLAKLNYLNSTEDPLRAHPHFWLSFIVTGDTAPVIFKEKFSWGIELALILVFILLGLFGWRKAKSYHLRKP